MRVHCRGRAERPLQPGIIPSGKFLERATAYLAEFANVVLERFVAKETAPVEAKFEGGLPRRVFQCRRRPFLERDALIPTLHRRDVSQEGANRVTGFIMQMIQFRDAQSLSAAQVVLL